MRFSFLAQLICFSLLLISTSQAQLSSFRGIIIQELPCNSLKYPSQGDASQYLIESTEELKAVEKYAGDWRIDWKQYSLLGQMVADDGNCGTQFLREVKQDSNNKEIVYNIHVNIHHSCKRHGRAVWHWVLIPKVPEGYTVKFKQSRTTLIETYQQLDGEWYTYKLENMQTGKSQKIDYCCVHGIKLTAEGSISTHDGCNSIGGQYRIWSDGESLEIDYYDLISTKRACGYNSCGSLIGGQDKFELKDGRLILYRRISKTDYLKITLKKGAVPSSYREKCQNSIAVNQSNKENEVNLLELQLVDNPQARDKASGKIYMLDGQRFTGIAIDYYQNGSKRRKTSIYGGFKIGKEEAWYTNGQLSYVGNYEQNLAMGDWIYYYTTGRKRAVETYLSGQPHGIWQEWETDGKLRHTKVFEHGILISID